MNEKTNTIPVDQVADILECILLLKESELHNIVIIRNAIGKSYDEIIEIFNNYEFQNDCSQVNPQCFVLEIRRAKFTLSCVFIDFICTEAYIFNDRYDLLPTA